MLPAGGSWVTYVPPASRSVWLRQGRPLVSQAGPGDFSLVIEKLDGDCLRCHVDATRSETVTFSLAGGLKQSSLAAWLTNETHWFVRIPDVHIAGGEFSLLVPADTIITLSTTTGQQKGSAAGSPPDKPV